MGYDTNPENMTNKQINKQDRKLLKMQKEENYLGNLHNAKDIAVRRMELHKEAQKRDF